MNVLVFGGSGMLGHKLVEKLRSVHSVTSTVRSADLPGVPDIFSAENTITGVDVQSVETVKNAIERAAPDVVINAVGLVKQRFAEGDDAAEMRRINSIFPNDLVDLSGKLGFRLITVSTDCVFSGSIGNYSENDIPDSHDLYGQSKRLGEPTGSNVLVLRTSIIGRELFTTQGLVEWFLSNRGATVEGFTKAIFSGFPTCVLADIIGRLIMEFPELSGLYHISSDPISKFDLLELIAENYETRTKIVPCDEPAIDRSLDSQRFRSATGWRPKTWPEMIKLMCSEFDVYEVWRKSKH